MAPVEMTSSRPIPATSTNVDLLDSYLDESKDQPGPYLRYFMAFYLIFYVLLVLPAMVSKMLFEFSTLLGIFNGLRTARAIRCVFRMEIDSASAVREDLELSWQRKMRIAFQIVLFPGNVCFCVYVFVGFLGTVIAAPFFAIVLLPVLFPAFWRPKHRKGLRRSLLQAAAIVANSTWSAMLIPACKGRWDIDAAEEPKKDPKPPGQWKKRGALVVFFLFAIALPINDTVSDFLYSKTLLKIYVASRDAQSGDSGHVADLLTYVIFSFSSAFVGLGITVYTFVRVGAGLRRAYLQVPRDMLLYPLYQLDMIEDNTPDHAFKPRLRTKVLKILGATFEDLLQLVLLFLSGPYTSSFSNVFYFSLATSVIGLSVHLSEIFTSLSAFQTIKKIPKIVLRLTILPIVILVLVFPILANLTADINPFCSIDHIYNPVLDDQFESCPYLMSLTIRNSAVSKLEIPCSVGIFNLNVIGNDYLESLSFPELSDIGGIAIIDNSLLQTVSMPKAQGGFDVFQSVFGVENVYPSLGLLAWRATALLIINNTSLESFIFGVDTPTLEVTDNPKLRTLGNPEQYCQVTFMAKIQRNPLLETIAVKGPAEVIITDNDSLVEAHVVVAGFHETVAASGLAYVRITGNAALTSVYIELQDATSVYITSGPPPTEDIWVVIADNPMLNTVIIVGSDYEVFNFTGVVNGQEFPL